MLLRRILIMTLVMKNTSTLQQIEIPCNDERDIQCVSFQTIDGNDEYKIKRSLIEDHVPYPKCKHTAKELKANNYGQLQENQERIPVNVSSQSQRSNSDLATAYLKNSCSNSREDVNDEDAKVRNLPSEYIKEEKEHNVNGSTVIHNTEKDGLNTRETNTELKISPSQENGVTTDSSDQMSHSQEDRKNLPGDTVQQPQDAKPGSAAPAPTDSTREDVNDEDAKVWNLPCESIKEEKEHNVNESIVIHNTEKDEVNTRETNTELKISPSQENGGTTDSSGQMSHSQEDRKNLPGDAVQQPQEAKPGSAGPAPTAGTRSVKSLF
ncbi:uncharacterized protein [Periplaneta americana]|uniref:uncharacterized protein n=1 Tax=Periplaneta americana TaxID=6978 RepID=UPI0037E8BE4C